MMVQLKAIFHSCSESLCARGKLWNDRFALISSGFLSSFIVSRSGSHYSWVWRLSGVE